MPAGPLTSQVSQKITADTNNLAPSIGFLVNLDGTLSFRQRGDAALITFPLKAGVIYAMDLIEVSISGSTTITQVLILRQGGKL